MMMKVCYRIQLVSLSINVIINSSCIAGKAVFWHSTAHIMGEALERLYGCHLCYGPPIVNGFYYDMFMNQPPCSHAAHCGDSEDGVDEIESATTVKKHHYPFIEELMRKICDEKQPFERLELSKDQLLEMFSYNQFKVRILKEKVKEDRTTVYRCGSLIDLCLGPHIRHTGLVKALKVIKVSMFTSSYQSNEKPIIFYILQ